MKYNKLIFLLGIFIILIAFLFTGLSYFRIILNVIGVSLLVYTVYISGKMSKKMSTLLFILFMLISILIDSIIVFKFNRIPVYSYNVITNHNSKVYNALGYRVWDCENQSLKVDRLYRLGYYCNVDDMEAIESNAFLGEVVDNYDNYKNNYIKITGKISKKEGINYIEMQSYQSNEITLNGYVNFSDSVTLRAVFKSSKESLNSYDIYDTITVVGKIWYLKKNGDNYIVYMDDCKVVDEEKLGDYSIIVTESKSCEFDKKLLHAGADYNIYSHCLDNVIVRYDENNIYELSSILSSGKLKIDDILKKSTGSNKTSLGTKLYFFDKYSILKCSESTGSDIIIGNTQLPLEDTYCGVSDEE